MVIFLGDVADSTFSSFDGDCCNVPDTLESWNEIPQRRRYTAIERMMEL